MSTKTLDRPDTRTDSGTDSPDVFHYVRKDSIIKSAVDGDHVVALCGEVFPVTKVPKPNSPVCQECQQILGRMAP